MTNPPPSRSCAWVGLLRPEAARKTAMNPIIHQERAGAHSASLCRQQTTVTREGKQCAEQHSSSP
jgi:hypothetical protein